MNNDQLKKGKDIADSLERLHRQKASWESSNKVDDISIKDKDNRSLRVSEIHVNFEVLQALTLDTINKKISALQKEFDTL